MVKKILSILGSIRFWIITLTALVAFLTVVEQNGFNMVNLLQIVQDWLIAVVGLGTLDSIAQNISGTKK